MKKFLIGLLMFLIITIGGTIWVTAQENTPPEPLPVEYNWCSDPDVWGDGRCFYPDDENLTYCHWEVGWYLPRAFNGEFALSDIRSPCMAFVTLSDDALDGAGVIAIPVCNGYIIIVLQGSPYTANPVNVFADDYDGSAAVLGGNCGLEIHGNNTTNVITGSAGHDRINTYGGNDTVYGDSITGDGSGNDTIDTGDGNDTVYGDTFSGNGSGNDVINGGTGDDTIIGDSFNGNGSGNDRLNGQDGNDTIYGDSVAGDGSGDDRINGGNGNDTLSGDTGAGDGTGNDIINGQNGDDTMYGDSVGGTGSGDDTINGGSGVNDSVSGPGNSDDTVTNTENDTSTADN